MPYRQTTIVIGVCVCVLVCACVRACVSSCVRLCLSVYVFVCVCARASVSKKGAGGTEGGAGDMLLKYLILPGKIHITETVIMVVQNGSFCRVNVCTCGEGVLVGQKIV